MMHVVLNSNNHTSTLIFVVGASKPTLEQSQANLIKGVREKLVRNQSYLGINWGVV